MRPLTGVACVLWLCGSTLVGDRPVVGAQSGAPRSSASQGGELSARCVPAGGARTLGGPACVLAGIRCRDRRG